VLICLERFAIAKPGRSEALQSLFPLRIPILIGDKAAIHQVVTQARGDGTPDRQGTSLYLAYLLTISQKPQRRGADT
jgi:hypothetical protein